MKSNLLKNVLDGVLFTSLVLSIIFFVKYFNQTRQSRTLTGELARYQESRVNLNRLLNETWEYSKRNPDMARLLESVNLARSAGNTNVAPRPAGK
jgi:hypothetical protein